MESFKTKKMIKIYKLNDSEPCHLMSCIKKHYAKMKTNRSNLNIILFKEFKSG